MEASPQREPRVNSEVMTPARREVPGLRLLDLAIATELRGGLSEFGKCVTLFISALALLLEAGATYEELDTVLRSTRAAAIDTAAAAITEDAPGGRN